MKSSAPMVPLVLPILLVAALAACQTGESTMDAQAPVDAPHTPEALALDGAPRGNDTRHDDARHLSDASAADAGSTCVPRVDWTKLVVQLNGRREHVWNVSDRGSTTALPDGRITVYRTATGNARLTLPHYDNYQLAGPDLASLNATPRLTFASTTTSTVAQADYNYRQWIFSPYSFDGEVLWALAHSEWYGCLAYPGDSLKDCSRTVGGVSNQLKSWVNGITLFRSDDRGRSWTIAGNPAAPAEHVVVAPSPPYPGWDFWSTARILNYGVFHPSNLVRQDDYLYGLARYSNRNVSGDIVAGGLVMIRSATSAISGQSWEMLDAAGTWRPAAFPMSALPGTGPYDHTGITFNQALCRYLMVMYRYDDSQLYFSTSASLESPSWSSPQRIDGQEYFLSRADRASPGFVAANYANLIDPTATGFNLETSGTAPYLYYATFRSSDVFARNVRRVRLDVKDSLYQPVPLEAGLFRVGAGIYAANSLGHYCSFTNWEAFVAITGRTNVDGIPIYGDIPPTMTNDGVCAG